MTIHTIFPPNTSWYTTELKLQKHKLRLLEKTLPKPTYPKSAQSTPIEQTLTLPNLIIYLIFFSPIVIPANVKIFKLANNLLRRIPS